jgi:hypothetical protein
MNDEDYLLLISLLAVLSTEKSYDKFDANYGDRKYQEILNQPKYSEVKREFRNSLIDKYWSEFFSNYLHLAGRTEESVVKILTLHSPEYASQYKEGCLSMRQLVNFSLDL